MPAGLAECCDLSQKTGHRIQILPVYASRLSSLLWRGWASGQNGAPGISAKGYYPDMVRVFIAIGE